jgi:hypothetical protein
VLSIRLTQDFNIRSTSHYILNASTASHYSPNCIDTHPFFKHQCFSETLKQFYHFDSGTILPFGVFGLPLTRDSYIRFITHYVQNALTSPYCSQIYTAIHLIFHFLCFWTRRNDWIALVAMHLVYCVKPSTHAGLPHPLYQPLHIECINSIPLQPELHWYSSILPISMLLDTLSSILSLGQRYHTSFCCVKPSTHTGLTLRLIAHNVQNALTSSYWSQNYTVIHLFFCN